MKIICLTHAVIVVALLGADHARAQTVDVPPFPKRAEAVQKATTLLASRGQVKPLPELLPTPFAFAGERGGEPAPAPDSGDTTPVVVAEPLARDLIATLARMVPATGTVVLGSNRMLLTSQKRLKVGDVYTITLDGRTHDVTISAIDTTTFTILFRGETFTRAVRLQNSSQPQPKK